jgi:DNA-binding CsgD family transcriptional regulator
MQSGSNIAILDVSAEFTGGWIEDQAVSGDVGKLSQLIAEAATSALEQQGRAVIGLNGLAQVTYVSKLAATYIGEAFDISGSMLKAHHESQRHALDLLVQSLTSREIPTVGMRPTPVSRGQGKPALVAYGCRLPEAEIEIEIFSLATALLIFIDPEKPQNIPAELLMDYFGFTHAEARLAISVLNGATPEHHAKESAISIVTARNHLQSLISKTNTHSKAELVALVRRVVP